jgi:hypothetical protein
LLDCDNVPRLTDGFGRSHSKYPWRGLGPQEEGSMEFAARISRHRSVAVFVILVGIVAVWMSQRPAGAQKTELNMFWPTPPKVKILDFEQDGFRLGDRLAARGPIQDGARTNQVGYGYLDCVVMNKITDDPGKAPGGLFWCTAVLRLADGDLTVEGLDPHGPGVYTFAVIGGTGAYADASGEATLTDGPEGTEWVIDLS